jgi:hypothetical protein
MFTEEIHHALRRGIVEELSEVLRCFTSNLLASGKKLVLIGSKRGFAVLGVD